MRAIGITFLLIMIITSLSAQSLKDISFGSDNTFDFATWNIEWFPKDGQKTADSVEKIIQALDAEILALQEIGDTFTFNKMIKKLADYDWFYDPGYHGGLAYVYKKSALEILDLYEIYTQENYWHSLPRAPLVLEVKYRDTKYVFINNHLKCCGDGYLNINDDNDEEKRRLDGITHIKYHIDNFLPEENVILLGDLNDLITDPVEHNVFQAFIDDPDHYLLADLAIAEGNQSGWSYPGWPSHLDHIIITNELFDEFAADSSEIRTIEIDDYFAGGFREYDATVSDHRPVGMKLITTSSTAGTGDKHVPINKINIYPNPSRGTLHMAFNVMSPGGAVELYNTCGVLIDRITLQPGQRYLEWTPDNRGPGLYIVKLSSGREILAVEKLVILK